MSGGRAHVLVTGGCGFIGGHLCRALAARGHALTVLDDLSSGEAQILPAGARLVEGCVTDAGAVAAALAGTEAVVHLAAVSSVEACTARPEETRRVNRGGTEALLAQLDGRSLVYTSSAAVYGDQAVQPVREEAQLAPRSAYAADKAASEAAIAAACAGGLQRAVALRPFNVFGPGQRRGSPYSGVITLFAERVQAGLPLRINGDGGQTRDFVHVRDVVTAALAALDMLGPVAPGLYEAVNVSTGRALAIRDLAAMVERLGGSGARAQTAPERPGDIRHSSGDPGKAMRLLGWAPTTDVERDLAAVLREMAAPGASAAG